MKKLRVADTIAMDLSFKNSSLSTGTLRSPLWVSLTAIAVVFLVFVADWIIPATVVVGMAYQAPIVFAGLRGTRRLTIQVTALGVIGLAIGWFMDLAADSYHFSPDRIENRLLSVISLLVVSFLSLRAQRTNANLRA
jgi:hypothetical protein